jgi:hypothetical protein
MELLTKYKSRVKGMIAKLELAKRGYSTRRKK